MMTLELSKRVKIYKNEQNDLVLTYPGGSVIRFNRRIGTKDWVSRVDASVVPKDGDMLPHLGQGEKVASAEQQVQSKVEKPVPEKKKKSKSKPINEFHKQLGGI